MITPVSRAPGVARLSPSQTHPKAPLTRKISISPDAVRGVLERDWIMSAITEPAALGGEMSTRTHETRSPLARFGRRFVAIVTEMNRAQNHLASAQHTPERF